MLPSFSTFGISSISTTSASVPSSSGAEFDYHATPLFNLIDRDGYSYPHWKGKRKSPRKEVYSEDEQIALIERELSIMSPLGVLHVDQYEQSALHLAVSQPVMSMKIVSALIEANPGIVKLQNCHGNLAMHIIILNESHFLPMHKCDYEVLRLLYEKYPESLTVMNSFEQTPIKTALSRGAAGVIPFLWTMDAKAVLCQFKIEWNRLLKEECDRLNRNTPLHLRLFSSASPEEILELLKAHPQYVMSVNCMNRVPYETAEINYKHDKHTRDFILRAILRTMDTVTRTPTVKDRQAFKASQHYRELINRNWSCRSGAMLLAVRYKNGLHFEVLKWVALFL